MYIASVRIENYRCFLDTTIEFLPGVTVVIGENNAGKTSLLRALSLVLARDSRSRPTADDFSRLNKSGVNPPTIRVVVTLRSSTADTVEDRALVATWLTKTSTPWEATLTYEFFLPADQHEEFKEQAGDAPTDETIRYATELLLPKFVARVWAGKASDQRRAEPEMLEKINLQLLDALRDVEVEMFRGRNSLLKSVLSEVLDQKEEHAKVAKASRKAFKDEAGKLLKGLLDRLNHEQLFSLIDHTGAKDGGIPTLGGTLREEDVLAALLLLIEKLGFQIPASHNGLGYNNLVYIALVLATLDYETAASKGDNAQIFPVLAIEEPEAHLHPSMQSKLLRYLRKRLRGGNKSRQLFITTHSTHITAAAGLDALICFSTKVDGTVTVSYPGKVFPATPDGAASKKYVERYLDATKSAMLFAKGVLFVEGIAENLVIPTLAESIDVSLEHHHVALVAVGGLTFKHFLHLFGPSPAALPRPVACLIDADPSRKEKAPNARWKSCFHFEVGQDVAKYDYMRHSSAIATLQAHAATTPNIKIFPGQQTFEYDFAADNAGNILLLADRPALEKLVKELTNRTISSTWLTTEEEVALEAITPTSSLGMSRFAACYLREVAADKGVHAFDLERRLRDDLEAGAKRVGFKVSPYIAEAIKWACKG